MPERFPYSRHLAHAIGEVCVFGGMVGLVAELAIQVGQRRNPISNQLTRLYTRRCSRARPQFRDVAAIQIERNTRESIREVALEVAGLDGLAIVCFGACGSLLE